MLITCLKCGAKRKAYELRCSECNGPFTMVPDFKYRDVKSNYPYVKRFVTLGEVVTPIVDYNEFSVKLEYFSPTFSYKDRGSRTLVSSLLERTPNPGNVYLNEDSSGNAGASIAAYGSRAGFRVNIFVPETTMASKISQIRSYGAAIMKIAGGRERVAEAAENSPGIYGSHVLNPEFRDGIREIAYEIFRQTEGKLPDNIFLPVSAGTLLLGIFNGFKHLLDSGEIEAVPKIVAVQTRSVNPLCSKLEGVRYDPEAVGESIADALVSRRPVLLDEMTRVVQKYGQCITVNEESILDARNRLSRKGMYTEYSSATTLAAFLSRKFEGRSLLILTGNGLKTP
ncbi:MAG: pyridoxal-phosphate dependent enzyme [Thermoplasmataceae archaeon]